MDFYAKKTRNLSKEQYIALLRKVIDEIIDSAARQGYAIEDGDTAEHASSPTPRAADETPGDVPTPPQPSNKNAEIIKLLRRISKDIEILIKIFEKI